MANDLCRRQNDVLEPQRLGFLPTRAFWQGRSRARLLAPWQLSALAIMGVASGITGLLCSGWLVSVLCAPASSVVYFVAAGLFERYIRRAAIRGARFDEVPATHDGVRQIAPPYGQANALRGANCPVPQTETHTSASPAEHQVHCLRDALHRRDT